MNEFPKWVYFKDGTSGLYPDATALAAEPREWAENPSHWTEPAKAELEPAAEPAKQSHKHGK